MCELPVDVCGLPVVMYTGCLIIKFIILSWPCSRLVLPQLQNHFQFHAADQNGFATLQDC